MNLVIHHINASKFEIDTDGMEEGNSAHLTYQILDNKNVKFTHTFVPFRQRGKGYAEALVKAGLGWAKNNNMLISSSCWYVKKYITEHPE
jgi:predicted GNAT family acetyltransferase